jgi:hypothetical protein
MECVSVHEKACDRGQNRGAPASDAAEEWGQIFPPAEKEPASDDHRWAIRQAQRVHQDQALLPGRLPKREPSQRRAELMPLVPVPEAEAERAEAERERLVQHMADPERGGETETLSAETRNNASLAPGNSSSLRGQGHAAGPDWSDTYAARYVAPQYFQG